MTESTRPLEDHQSQITNRQFLSVIVPTFNEESNIAGCLAGLSFADEVLVVDSFSSDRTVEIARGVPGVRVLQHPYAGNGPQCNWGMEQAKGPWILIVDADERVSAELAEEIRSLLKGVPSAPHYRLRRQNVFLGRVIRHSGWADRLVRLVRKGAARYPEQKVHADIEPVGPAPTLRSPLTHDTAPSLSSYVAKLHRYALWGAEDLARRGRRSGPLAILGRPAWRFVRTYFVQLGVLDGGAGLLVCALQAYGTFLKWATLWEMQKKR